MIDVSIFRSMAIGTIGVIFVAIIGSLVPAGDAGDPR
jgi:hypothetical protein